MFSFNKMYQLGSFIRHSNFVKMKNPLQGSAVNIHSSAFLKQEHHELDDVAEDSNLSLCIVMEMYLVISYEF